MALLIENVMSLAVKSCWCKTVRATSARTRGADDVVVVVDDVVVGEGLVKWAERAVITKAHILSTNSTVDWSSESGYLSKIVRERDFSSFHTFDSLETSTSVFNWLWQRQELMLLRETFHFLLELVSAEAQAMGVSLPKLVSTMIDFTATTAAPLATMFSLFRGWTDLESPLRKAMTEGAPNLLLALVTGAQEAQELVVRPFSQILRQVPHISLPAFAELVKVISLTVRSQEVALDLLLGSIEPESARLLEGLPDVVRHFVKSMIGLALDHMDEAKEARSFEDGLLDLKREKKYRTISARLRIEARFSRPLQLSDHQTDERARPRQRIALTRACIPWAPLSRL